VKYRDFDGVVRPVSRFGASRAKAEAALEEALQDRYGTGAGEITRWVVFFAAWRSAASLIIPEEFFL